MVLQETEVDMEQGQSGISKRHMSKAANSHKFQKIQKPSKCRECDKYVYWQGYDCADCGPASHKKCLETLWSQETAQEDDHLRW